MTRPPARVASGTTGYQNWSVGELWALSGAVAVQSFLQGQSERKDWREILAFFNDIRAFADPSAAGTSRAPDHLKCQWRHMGRDAERERTIAAKFADRFNAQEERSQAHLVHLAKTIATEEAEAARREAAAIAMQNAEARRERRKLQVRARRAAARAAAGQGAISTSTNRPSENASIASPSPAPARGAATARPPPAPRAPTQFWPGRLPPLEEMYKYFNDGFISMAKSLDAVADADAAADPTSPALGRAVISAIRAASESSVAAHLTAGALERALNASEDSHKRGIQFQFDHLVDPVVRKVGGPLAAAVVKCCCCLSSSAGQQQQQQPADVDPATGRRAATVSAPLDRRLVEAMGLDPRDAAAAPELVDGALLARLGAQVAAMNPTLASLPAVEDNYISRFEAARRVSAEVIEAALAAASGASVAVASASAASAARNAAANGNAAATSASAAAARNAGATSDPAPPLFDLMDAANDEFARSFQRVDVDLLTNLVTVLGCLADTARSRIDMLHAALRASSDRHEGKARRDAAMLLSLRRVANGGEGSSSGASAGVALSAAASAALAGVLAAYDRAVEAALESGADFAVVAAAALRNEQRPLVATPTVATAGVATAVTGVAAPARAATALAAAAAAATTAPAAAPAAAAAPRSAAASNGQNGQRVNNKKNKRKRNKRQKPNSAPPAPAPAPGDSVPDDEAFARLAVSPMVEDEPIDPAGDINHPPTEDGGVPGSSAGDFNIAESGPGEPRPSPVPADDPAAAPAAAAPAVVPEE